MTPSQFWYGNPRLILNYKEKFNAEQMRQQQDIWRIGMYFKYALDNSAIQAILATKETIAKIKPFPEMPKFEEKIQLSKKQIDLERDRLYLYYKKLAKINNSKNSG